MIRVDLMLEDTKFCVFYRSLKEWLTSPDHLTQADQRQMRAALSAEREARVVRQTKM